VVFPSSNRDLKQALGRIPAILGVEYPLAYYPRDLDRRRRIEVRVKRSGVGVVSRTSVGAEGPFRFSGCIPRDDVVEEITRKWNER
jgi:hypothetical protein